MADHVIETTGKSEMIELAYSITAPDGKTILVGVPDKKIHIYMRFPFKCTDMTLISILIKIRIKC